MVVDGKDFMWASPTATKSNPEALLEDFLRHTGVSIGKIRIDDAGELARSESFKMWCAGRDIVLCPTAGYNHTMQARAEGAVRITKEHIRCLLKTANMPFRFWPWALTHFCRTYNYWPCKGHSPPWVMLGNHRYCQALHRDIHPFGCYTIGRLPREHPRVVNTTLSDRGLEGAFLGWDMTTPTCWIWSFKDKKPIRLHDPIFYDTRFPFSDPTCLVNRDYLSWEDIRRMHAVDEDDDTESDEECEVPVDEVDSELSQAPTQQPAAPTPAFAKQPLPTPSSPAPSRPRTRSQSPSAPGSLSGERMRQEGRDSPSGEHSPSGERSRRPSGERTRPTQPGTDRIRRSSTCLPISSLDEQWRTTKWFCRSPATGGEILDCQLVTPSSARREGQILQLPVGTTRGKSPYNLRRLLNIRFNHPRTLGDLVGAGPQTPPGCPQTPSACPILARGGG
mmetsp:Transcript_29600/g.60737  ORF Transcript_29600/g.60737 Transcript_29600/m.60737 type:complete len:449 (+) Transcript_29600:267-1613(+)